MKYWELIADKLSASGLSWDPGLPGGRATAPRQKAKFTAKIKHEALQRLVISILTLDPHFPQKCMCGRSGRTTIGERKC
jgi:hypothetical protein